MQHLRSGLTLLFMGLALFWLNLQGAFASDLIWVSSQPIFDLLPCTATVQIPVFASLSTPVRELHLDLRIMDVHPLIPTTESQFTGRFIRGPGAPESLFYSIHLALSEDSTGIHVTLLADRPVTVGTDAHLLDLEVLAEARQYAVYFSVGEDTAAAGPGSSLVDSAYATRSTSVQTGWFQTLIDFFPPPPNESVSASCFEIKRAHSDTIVSASVSYFTMMYYEHMSIPIRIKPIGVDAYILPGSVLPTDWAGPTNHLSFDLTVFPDSSGFWLELFAGPFHRDFLDTYDSKPLVQFDIAISGVGPGVVYVDTALIAGGLPLEFVDYCPDYFTPGFSRGQISVGAVAISSAGQALPTTFELLAPFPNPFNAGTRIRVKLAEPTKTCIEIVNLLGQVTTKLWDGDLSAGSHEFVWNASDAASGLYVVRARGASHVRTAKLMLLK